MLGVFLHPIIGAGNERRVDSVYCKVQPFRFAVICTCSFGEFAQVVEVPTIGAFLAADTKDAEFDDLAGLGEGQ
jgi:hypothetical protein